MLQYLLDTHTLIWYINGDFELSQIGRMAIEEENATNFVSIASLWEMAIKISLGKLELKMPFDHIEQQIAANGFEILPITLQDILTVSTLPFHHRDPFDRIIIAQSLNNDMIVISKDKFFDQYQAKVRW